MGVVPVHLLNTTREAIPVQCIGWRSHWTVTVDGEMSCGSQARYVHPGQVYKTREQTSALTLHLEHLEAKVRATIVAFKRRARQSPTGVTVDGQGHHCLSSSNCHNCAVPGQ